MELSQDYKDKIDILKGSIEHSFNITFKDNAYIRLQNNSLTQSEVVDNLIKTFPEPKSNKIKTVIKKLNEYIDKIEYKVPSRTITKTSIFDDYTIALNDIIECKLCCCKYNLVTHAKLECNYCHYHVCKACVKILMRQSKTKFSCVNCKKEFSRKDIRNQLGITFATKEYKCHLEEVYFEKEKSLFPATQLVISDRIEADRLRDSIKPIEEKILELHAQIAQTREKISELRESGIGNTRSKSNFIKKCQTDNCKGFLDNSWTCHMCNMITCRKCYVQYNKDIVENHEQTLEINIPMDSNMNNDETHMEIDDKPIHVCKPEDIENAKFIMTNTKNCPGCGILIFKISGCYQMFCTQCHTAFDWGNGRILDKNRIHNPHFFEWARDNPTYNPDEDVCIHEIDYTVWSTFNNKYFGAYPQKTNSVVRACRNIMHYSDMLRRRRNRNYNDNLELRIMYMKNEISEDYFKRTIQKSSKKCDKNNEINDIVDLYCRCGSDIILRYFEIKKPIDSDFLNIYEELKKLKKYCNDLFADVSFTYNCNTLTLDNIDFY